MVIQDTTQLKNNRNSKLVNHNKPQTLNASDNENHGFETCWATKMFTAYKGIHITRIYISIYMQDYLSYYDPY